MARLRVGTVAVASSAVFAGRARRPADLRSLPTSIA